MHYIYCIFIFHNINVQKLMTRFFMGGGRKSKYNTSCSRQITYPFHRHTWSFETFWTFPIWRTSWRVAPSTAFALDWKTFPLAHSSTCLAKSGTGGWYEVPSTVYQPLSHPNRIFWKTEKLFSDGCRIGAIRSRASTHCFCQISLAIFPLPYPYSYKSRLSTLGLDGSTLKYNMIGGLLAWLKF